MKLLFFLLTSAVAFGQCDCDIVSLKDAKQDADIIFRGTITEIRESGRFPVAVFHVTRVWKGDVTETFEMLAIKNAAAGFGFVPALKVGNEMLVLAKNLEKKGDYLPMKCSRTALVKDSNDVKKLGHGRKPKPGSSLGYLPIQKVAKIRFKISSAVVAPVIASIGRSAP